MVIAPLIALLAAAVAISAEWIHARRVKRVARLAFGPTGRAAGWTVIAPWVRCIGVATAVFGGATLAAYDPMESDEPPSPHASRQLLICLDVSPSMQIKDAGPDAEKISRARWAGKLVQAILDRIDMKETRISVVAFYSKALPVLQESTDKNVVANMLDGLPMYVAFEAGKTDLAAGVNESLQMARPWGRKSATLVVITDGDADPAAVSSAIPPSIADAIVIGVGDTNRPTIVAGHSSRQDPWSLKQLAAKLGGVFHEGNRLHLPREILERLKMVSPRAGASMGIREIGLVCLGVGSGLLALIGPALMLFGLPAEFAAGRRPVQARFTPSRT
ncbi:MAG: VWA domain-containing protein [Planctomycetes bacterium]|nr:VWA domain-containing protein [Planctomycetota bacterium]